MTARSARGRIGGRDAAAQDAEKAALERAQREWDDLVATAESARDDELAGMGYKGVFHFARELKATLSRGDGRPVTGEDAAEYVENRFERVRDSLGLTTDEAWDKLGLESESGDMRAEFVDAWDTVRVPAGKTLWQTAEENARSHPHTPKEHAKNRKYVLFVSLAAHLQKALPPNESIALPVGKVAKVLGVSEQMVSVYRRWATEAGLLHEVAKYSRENKRATRFKFALDRFRR